MTPRWYLPEDKQTYQLSDYVDTCWKRGIFNYVWLIFYVYNSHYTGENQLVRVICFWTHWSERNISSEPLTSVQMLTIKMQFWFHSNSSLSPCIWAISGEEIMISRKGRLGIMVVGSVTPGFAMRTLGCTGGQGWGTGLFVQLNLGPQAMDKSWANRDPGVERAQKTAGCSASGFRICSFFLCTADNAAFFLKQHVPVLNEICPICPRPRASPEAEDQDRKQQWAVSWGARMPRTGSTRRSSDSWLCFYPHRQPKARAWKENHCLFP